MRTDDAAAAGAAARGRVAPRPVVWPAASLLAKTASATTTITHLHMPTTPDERTSSKLRAAMATRARRQIQASWCGERRTARHLQDEERRSVNAATRCLAPAAPGAFTTRRRVVSGVCRRRRDFQGRYVG